MAAVENSIPQHSFCYVIKMNLGQLCFFFSF